MSSLYRPGMDLTEYFEDYSYFPEFTRYIFDEVGKTIRYRRSLKREDIVLISVWKTLWKKEGLEIRMETSEYNVEKVTSRIFTANHDDQAEVRGLLLDIEGLCSVSAVTPVKLASTILSVTLPEKYGVFDIRVAEALGIKGSDERAAVDAIFKMREIAHEHCVLTKKLWTPRMVDQALFVLHKQNKGLGAIK